MTPPPSLFGTFAKIHPFWCCHPSLSPKITRDLAITSLKVVNRAIFKECLKHKCLLIILLLSHPECLFLWLFLSKMPIIKTKKKHFWCPNQSLKTTLVVQTFPKYGNIFYILTEPRTVKFQVLGDQTTSGNLHSGVVIDLGGAVLPGSYPTTMAATTTEWISN